MQNHETEKEFKVNLRQQGKCDVTVKVEFRQSVNTEQENGQSVHGKTNRADGGKEQTTVCAHSNKQNQKNWTGNTVQKQPGDEQRRQWCYTRRGRLDAVSTCRSRSITASLSHASSHHTKNHIPIPNEVSLTCDHPKESERCQYQIHVSKSIFYISFIVSLWRFKKLKRNEGINCFLLIFLLSNMLNKFLNYQFKVSLL